MFYDIQQRLSYSRLRHVHEVPLVHECVAPIYPSEEPFHDYGRDHVHDRGHDDDRDDDRGRDHDGDDDRHNGNDGHDDVHDDVRHGCGHGCFLFSTSLFIINLLGAYIGQPSITRKHILLLLYFLNPPYLWALNPIS